VCIVARSEQGHNMAAMLTVARERTSSP
jgi:hypothetical protein